MIPAFAISAAATLCQSDGSPMLKPSPSNAFPSFRQADGIGRRRCEACGRLEGRVWRRRGTGTRRLCRGAATGPDQGGASNVTPAIARMCLIRIPPLSLARRIAAGRALLHFESRTATIAARRFAACPPSGSTNEDRCSTRERVRRDARCAHPAGRRPAGRRRRRGARAGRRRRGVIPRRRGVPRGGRNHRARRAGALRAGGHGAARRPSDGRGDLLPEARHRPDRHARARSPTRSWPSAWPSRESPPSAWTPSRASPAPNRWTRCRARPRWAATRRS